MEFHAANCPNCGGSLRLPDNLTTAKCMYCGIDIIVRNAINAAGANVENWLKIASSAAAANNSQEAYEYFTRVLEFEPHNYVALLGKAEAAGRLSTPTKFRGEELIKGVEAAVDNAPEDKKDEIKQQAADMIFTVCTNYIININMSMDYINMSDIQKAFDSLTVTDSLEFAHSYAPTNVRIIKSLFGEFQFVAAIGKRNKIDYLVDIGAKEEEYLSKLQTIAPETAASCLEKQRLS